MNKEQFFPTPKSLANKAKAMFNKGGYARVLEPSAGLGDLASVICGTYHNTHVDVVEYDVSKHDVLRGRGYNVVGTDFLSFTTPISYDAIFMNPPFRNGAQHVLHAWRILQDGEIVAILNAETVRNPCDKYRQQLAKIIDQHCSEVEYVWGAFQSSDTLIRSDVECAIIHLTKERVLDLSFDFSGMTETDCDASKYEAVNDERNIPALPNSSIKNMVIAYQHSIEAMKVSVKAEATASYYAGLLGVSNISKGASEVPEEATPAVTFDTIRKEINERADKIRLSAWDSVFQCTDFTSRFTQSVRSSIEQELRAMRSFEFTRDNIHGMLEGLLANKTELDMKAVEEVFDRFTRFGTDNAHYYKGWKSNDKHRFGMQLKSTRIIMPYMDAALIGGLDYEARRTLDDIDRVFAMLDGKAEISGPRITECASANKDAFRLAQRLTAEYWDLRYYRKGKTLHLFPRRTDLMDRMNRIVGARRRWIPDQTTDHPGYTRAADIDKVVRKTVPVDPWGRRDTDKLEEAIDGALDQLGIPEWDRIESATKREVECLSQ